MGSNRDRSWLEIMLRNRIIAVLMLFIVLIVGTIGLDLMFRQQVILDLQALEARIDLRISDRFRHHSSSQGAWAEDRQAVCDHIEMDCNGLPSLQPEYLER